MAEGYKETADHVALHYALYGHTGPLLVLCDGLGCDGFVWKYFLREFSEDHRIFHVQYRGHGQSSIPLDLSSLTIEQLAADLEWVLSQCLPQEKAILLGHSMGTQVILEFCKRFPLRTKGLIAICGCAGNTLETFLHSKKFQYLFPYILQFVRTAPRPAQFVWNHLISNPEGYYPAVLLQLTSTLCKREDLQPYLDHLAHIDPRVFVEMADEMGSHSMEKDLGKINVPTLVLAGTRDRFTPFEKSRLIAEKVPNAELCILRGASHTAPLELPELVHLRIRKFLKERLSS